MFSTSIRTRLLRPARPVAAMIAVLLCAIASPALGGPAPKAPDVPCNLEVPNGYEVFSHAYAVGVQMYIATCLLEAPCIWAFRGPKADLYDKRGNVVGRHYPTTIGPTYPVWEDLSGGTVVGNVVASATVDPTAIPWLRLEAKATSGSGPLEQTTHIQRVNTVGGLFPTTIPIMEGQVEDVPYTAEYYFFREAQK